MKFLIILKGIFFMKELKVLKELNVLYVDDDKKACDSLSQILKYYFKNVFLSNNGKQALDVYNQNKCHLLIVDYDMPIMNGYEFLSKIREVDENISAFIISSYDDKIKLKKAIKLNLLEYMTKPYELDELKTVLNLFVKQITKSNLLKYHLHNNCYYDMNKKIIEDEELTFKLTSFEVKILEYLLENENKIIKYNVLLDILESNNQKSLISIIYKLNKKLSIKIIHNIKDLGYKMSR